jgi:acyl-CoA:acyl-CoA alkyltransferase
MMVPTRRRRVRFSPEPPATALVRTIPARACVFLSVAGGSGLNGAGDVGGPCSALAAAVSLTLMKYQNVCLEAISCTLPDEIVTSARLEARLEPLYRRLRLPEGRLELMTGIRQRRFWPLGTLPSQMSGETAAKLIDAAAIDKSRIGALVHASVCRDYLEPATACAVHHRLGLGPDCLIYDVSNACLGILNGIVQVAGMIELGQIRAGLVVGTEIARPLVENTIRTLNADLSLTRDQMKLALASLTIGSGSAAVLLVDKELSRTGNQLLAATARAHTTGHELCRGRDEPVTAGGQTPLDPLAGEGAGAAALDFSLAPLMQTDSEALLQEGVAAAGAAFDAFLSETGWTRAGLHKTFCHQVGSAHRKLLMKTLELDASIDFATYETLGNTGSVALPVTMALGIDSGHLQGGDHAALLGIGSGINVLMLAVDWQKSLITRDAGKSNRQRVGQFDSTIQRNR